MTVGSAKRGSAERTALVCGSRRFSARSVLLDVGPDLAEYTEW
jgi:hypothetical protein